MSELSEQDRRHLVQKIHDSATRLVISVAGGSMALADLQTAPGASRTLLEGLAPYSGGAVRSLVGEEPMPHVSEDGAATLAQACLARALDYAAGYDDDFPVIGVSCTSALATQRQRRGEDRGWMAIAFDGAATKTRLLEFPSESAMGGNDAGQEAAAAEHADTFYERRMTQERELANALLLFIAENIAA